MRAKRSAKSVAGTPTLILRTRRLDLQMFDQRRVCRVNKLDAGPITRFPDHAACDVQTIDQGDVDLLALFQFRLAKLDQASTRGKIVQSHAAFAAASTGMDKSLDKSTIGGPLDHSAKASPVSFTIS